MLLVSAGGPSASDGGGGPLSAAPRGSVWPSVMQRSSRPSAVVWVLSVGFAATLCTCTWLQLLVLLESKFHSLMALSSCHPTRLHLRTSPAAFPWLRRAQHSLIVRLARESAAEDNWPTAHQPNADLNCWHMRERWLGKVEQSPSVNQGAISTPTTNRVRGRGECCVLYRW
jgi:hypothetical protein